MGYFALTAAEIAQDKFVTTTLMAKLKDNFDYLYSKAAATDLPSNGSFEIDTDSDGIPDNWTRALYPGGTGGLSVLYPAHGAKSAYFIHPGGAGNGGGILTSDYIEVSQLQSLSLFYILWATVAGMRNIVRIKYYDKAKAYISAVDLYNSTSNPTSGTLYCSQFIPVANARYIKILLYGGVSDTDVAGNTYFDSLRLVPTVITDLIKDDSITQAKLKTSQGEVSMSHAGSGEACGFYTLPGGEYGFHVRLKDTLTPGYGTQVTAIPGRGHGTSYVTGIKLCLSRSNSAGTDTAYAQQRYVTASGEVHWIFFLRNKETGKIKSAWQAPDHPCFGNGGKPLLMPHPFGNYDKTKHEIIVINPSLAEIEQMELETIVDDETKPDKDLLEVISENYEIDENSNPAWPDIPVTVGLPKHVIDKKTGRKTLADYRFMKDTIIEPVQKIIPKPDYIKVKALKRKRTG